MKKCKKCIHGEVCCFRVRHEDVDDSCIHFLELSIENQTKRIDNP